MDPSLEDNRQDNLLNVSLKYFGDMKRKKLLFISILCLSCSALNLSRVLSSRQPHIQKKVARAALEVVPSGLKRGETEDAKALEQHPTASEEGTRAMEEGPTAIEEDTATSLEEGTIAMKVVPTVTQEDPAAMKLAPTAENKANAEKDPRIEKQIAARLSKAEKETRTEKFVAAQNAEAERLVKQKTEEKTRTDMEEARIAKEKRIVDRLTKKKAAGEATISEEKWMAERLAKQKAAEETRIAKEKENVAQKVEVEQLAKEKAAEEARIARGKRIAERLAKQKASEEAKMVEDKHIAAPKSEAERLAKAEVERVTKLRAREGTAARIAEEKRIAQPGSTALYIEFNSDQFKEVYGGYVANKSLPPMTWSNMVFVVLVQNVNKLGSTLLNEHFNTWMKELGEGLDMVFIFDENDERAEKDLLPDTSKVKPTIHIYKSPASTIRNKVIDAFTFVEKKFGNDESKHFYIKMDPDTFIIPDNFLYFMKILCLSTYPKPVDFGRPACFEPTLCHSQGGIYGMSRSALQSMMSYMKTHPNLLEEYHGHRKNSENLMNHEDFAISYLFKKSTGLPMVAIRSIGENYNALEMPYDENVISINHVRFTRNFKKLQSYYDHMKVQRLAKRSGLQSRD